VAAWIPIKRLLPAILTCLAFSGSIEAPLSAETSSAEAPSAVWVEFRRALLINASSDEAHSRSLEGLEKALKDKGFVVTVLDDPRANGGVVYEKWVRSIPTMGVSLLYYCGRLDVVKGLDGEGIFYSMQIGGYTEIPPARDPSLSRSRPEDKPWLSLKRLSQKLGGNVARANMVVMDCLGFDDVANSELSLTDMHAQASGTFRGELFSSFYPGKAAFHPSKEEPEIGTILAGVLTSALKNGGPLPPVVKDLAHTVTPRDRVFELKHEAGEVCAPPDVLRKGRFAGDQWVDQNGFCFVWCPAATYTMGDEAFGDAQPVDVRISKGFWIGKYEVLGAEGSLFNAGGKKLGTGHRNLHFSPASIGSIDKVALEIEKWQVYGASQGIAYPGWTYEHPTEAEWEYACRAGTRAGYPCEIKDLGEYGNFADRNLYDDREPVHYIYAHREANDGYGRSFAPIGQFIPNAWGIHDMLGNLSELCSTYYSEALIGGVDPDDQTLPTTRSSRHRVSRGGAWCSPPEYLHVAYRNAFTGVGTPHIGLRLVLRQGARITRTRNEIIATLQAELAAERKAELEEKSR
jgi:formylglycine-generating enzyme required for sulfatase activity